MNLLRCLVELLFFINFVLIDKIEANYSIVCTIELKHHDKRNCSIFLENPCLTSNNNCLNSIINDLKNPIYNELKTGEIKLEFYVNKTCIYLQNCPECSKNIKRICDNFTDKKYLKYKSSNLILKIYSDKIERFRKNDSNNKIIQVFAFLIIILSIAIVLVVGVKRGYITIFEKINLNEKLIALKRRISMKTNKETYVNSFQDLIGSYENLSDNSTVNQSNVKCINEFKLICTNSKLQEEECNLTTNDGNHLTNTNKNRFLNILPFDQSRVKLQRTMYESDYINASYIPFFKNPSVKEYIACQGPLPNTITDFWWMVWEQNVSVIVMLTKLFENGRIKCEQYWPSLLNEEEELEENSDFSVLLTEEKEYSSFTERKLKLTNKISSKWRNIIHLQMHSWNDFSIPNLEEFEKSLYRFREITSSDNSPPYVIHCSAGVGRTGTFITIDRIMKKVLSGKPFVNIYEEVLELRKYRLFMVQQKGQYIFIHKFIAYFLKRYHEKDYDCEIEENIYEQ